MQVDEILETCLYVDDLEAAEHFYCQVLGMEFVNRHPGRHVFFRCGRQMLLIFNPKASSVSEDLPAHGAVPGGHVAFTVDPSSINQWRRHLEDCGVIVEKLVEWPQAQSLYFRDPAGNSLELASRQIWGMDT